jgi:hypothetical protein
MKAVMAGLVVVMAFSAVVASGASAASWWVGGSELGSSASLASGTVVTEHVQLAYSGLTVECSGVELKGADIAAHDGGQVEHLVLKGCASTSKNCALEGTKIESKPLSLEAALGEKGAEDKVVLKPATGTVLAEYVFTGSNCAFANEPVELTGKITLLMAKGREELAEQGFAFHVTESSKELKWGSFSMALTGAAKLKLASGEGWSFH